MDAQYQNRVAYDVFSGKPIPSRLLLTLHAQGVFPHPFWARVKDLKHFLSSSTLNLKHIKLLPSANPINAAVIFAGYKWFYNISHTTDPFELFSYFLYKRHFYGTQYPFHFGTQCILEKHARENGFQSRRWVTQKMLDNFDGKEFNIQPGSVCAPIKVSQLGLYNIMQTNRPKELLHRLENVPRSIIGGRTYPCSCWEAVYEYQMRNDFTQPLWCSKDELELIGLPVKDTSRGLLCNLERRGTPESIELINIDDFTDALAAYRVYTMERSLQRSCIDIFQSTVFSRSDTFRLCVFKNHTGFNSRFWIRQDDMKKVGATCLMGQEGCTARCLNGEWYNLQQVNNYYRVLRDVKEWKKKFNQGNDTSEPLSILDDIMGNGA